MSTIAEEQAVLGGLMYNPDVYQEVSQLEKTHFYEPFHARLYASIQKRISGGSIPDGILLADEFKQDPAFEELGGLRYLADLVDRAPPRSRVLECAVLVVDAANARQAANGTADRQMEIHDISEALSILAGLAVANPTRRPGRAVSMRDAAVAELDIARLPVITRQARRICEDPVGEATDRPIRMLGERLNELGGCELMAEIAETVAAHDPKNEPRRMATISTAWDGVGFWAT